MQYHENETKIRFNICPVTSFYDNKFFDRN